MSLYMIQFDGSQDYVEADNFAQAIELWQAYNVKQDCTMDADEQPESVSLVSDEPVIRGEPEEVKG